MKNTLTNWERQELESLRTLVRLYSQRINELETYTNRLERQIETMQQEYGWKINPDLKLNPQDWVVNSEREILNDKD